MGWKTLGFGGGKVSAAGTCVALGRMRRLSEPQFPYLHAGRCPGPTSEAGQGVERAGVFSSQPVGCRVSFSLPVSAPHLIHLQLWSHVEINDDFA